MIIRIYILVFFLIALSFFLLWLGINEINIIKDEINSESVVTNVGVAPFASISIGMSILFISIVVVLHDIFGYSRAKPKNDLSKIYISAFLLFIVFAPFLCKFTLERRLSALKYVPCEVIWQGKWSTQNWTHSGKSCSQTDR